MNRILIRAAAMLLVATWLIAMPQAASAQAVGCERTIRASVVALDQVFFWNRLGAVEPQGMIYALRRDVVPINGAYGLSPGNVMLRPDKRPRPLVLRMNVGDCLRVAFTNLLNPTPVDQEQPATRSASVHVAGMQLVNSIDDDGSYVGLNANSLANPGETKIYTFLAEREGGYIMYSGTPVGGEGNSGAIAAGLFGSVNVQPRGSEWYRSQVTRDDMDLATTGITSQGHPILNYDAVYPTGHAARGVPIFKMLYGDQIMHSDLTAIITGPNRGNFPDGTYEDTPVNPGRNRPFREFTIIFHDEVAAVQAFPQFFKDPVLRHTTHSVRDAFAINYGTGGIGAEIIANRLGVGPMWDCTDCKYEEFFLTSWAVSDSAMVVDVPANAPCTRDPSRPSIPDVPSPLPDPCAPTFGPKATKAFYPDDPSNVYHSYLNEHVKFRNLHAGSDDHHIFHLHAHQWVHTPDSDKSAYLDSQAIGQGSSFTYEITHNGSGNRNQTPGDSIFHCHFYPHFAQGMWAMWRVHDAFENGTPLNDDGIPQLDSRALPDGEIAAGTPIPGLVPVPTYTMPPMPQVQVSIVNGQVKIAGNGFAGYPFYIPGVAGHRPPHPPYDTIDDGGLPRHVITGGDAFHIETRLDFTKELEVAEAFQLPELGTVDERIAMDFHAKRWHPSFLPDGTAGLFKANGRGPVRGAPFADPCIDDFGNPVGGEVDPDTGNAKPARLYKAADIEMDVVLNKKGWHYPQQRFISLWEDVKDFKFGTKPPEPLFFRANSQECIEYHLTNLVPHIYEMDDFQVRTPTDILGQHIHLVKFDVTSSDGSGNGYNYEDGTFAPGEVRERIHAINAAGGLLDLHGNHVMLTAKDHYYFGPFSPDEDGDGIPDWRGAQTTAQRWYADETLDNTGTDRTLRTVFTHDHFGPSTHQQAGLYAGLVVEPKNSQWYHSETGVPFYTRADGGPTSWQAVIEGTDEDSTYREFMFEFADFQLAYEPNDKRPVYPYNKETGRLEGQGFDDPRNAVNPPGRQAVIDQLPLLYLDPINGNGCPIFTEDPYPGPIPAHVRPPCPEAVSADDPGMYSVNYRNEPLAFRLRDPNNLNCLTGPGPNGCQAKGKQGDPSYAYASINRIDTELNVQPTFYDPLTEDVLPTDPWTPMLRAYEGDHVQFRTLVGAHEQEHNFTIHGIKWLYEPSEPNSGYRNSQGMGISEHFEMIVPDLPKNAIGSTHDFLYKAGAASEAQWTGNWGIVRAYRSQRLDVRELSTNDRGNTPTPGGLGDFDGVCPKVAPKRIIEVVAVPASALPNGRVTYNSRNTLVSNPLTGDTHAGPIYDPTAIMFVRKADYNFLTGKVNLGTPIEPLVLRAAAGDCLEVTLFNELPGEANDLDGYNAWDNIVDYFNANEIKPSTRVGLHPQLLFYDVSRSDGVNVGINPEQTAAPSSKVTYQWYAGDVWLDRPTNTFKWKPMEFGATGLTSSDPLKHTNKGAVGALIIEPQGATWTEDANMRAAATVNTIAPDEFNAQFREFVVIFQSDINMRYGDGSEIKPPPDNEDPSERGAKAFNYRAEPIWFRMGIQPETPFTVTRTMDFTNVLSNSQVGGDPETPIFTATPGKNTRFRVLNPGGHGQFSVFEIRGHVWQEEPYVNGSSKLGSNPLSEWKGTQPHHGATNHFDAVLENGAGGHFKVTGDYLYRDYVPWEFFHGTWGIFRVGPTWTPPPPDPCVYVTTEDGDKATQCPLPQEQL